MPRKRQIYSAEFKFQVALEAAKGQKTMNELASQFGVHPNRVSEWKQALLKQGAQVFADSTSRQERTENAREAELYEQIGRLKMEPEWLKNKLPGSVEMKRQMLEPAPPQISLRRQCQLIDLNRSSWYYQPAGETAYNLLLMRLIDEQHTSTHKRPSTACHG